WLGDPKRPLFITEGARKADSAVSRGLCCVELFGVWNWRGTNDDGGKTALEDWELVALNGRDVNIVFDSDVVQNLNVSRSLQRFKGFLELRGAKVKIIYLPSGEGGVKVGLDDYFAAGHTVDDLLAHATDEIKMPESSASGDYASGDDGTLSQLLINLALENSELFHDAGGDCYATVTVADHRETHKLGSRDYKDWLAGLLYKTTQRAASGDKIGEAITVLRAKARYEAPEIETHV